MDEFEKTLCDWYVGEVGAETYFTCMAERAAGDREAEKWRLLAELERVTAARLLAELNTRDVPVPDCDARIADAIRRAKSRPDGPWREQMNEMRPRLEHYVALFRAACDQAPADGAAIAREYLAHEEALLDFVVSEIDGLDGAPAVERLLEHR